LLGQQDQYNQNRAVQQNYMNNPDQSNPYGSKTTTQDPTTGKWSVNTQFSAPIQQQFDQQNQFNTKSLGQASSLLDRGGLNYNGAPAMPTFNTSGVSAIPDASESNLNKTRDAVYAQNTQYLDPQFQQGQSDMDVKLANQGIMPGSEAYNREVNNFALNKQKAYGDARNSSIAAGGAEQSRQFGLGLQSHQQGMNDALTNFNTGLQSRQQGVSESNNQYSAPVNALATLRGGSQIQSPTFGSTTGTSIPGVDFTTAAQSQYNASLGDANANNAYSNNITNGLFGLGNAALQNPGAVSSLYNYGKGLFGLGAL